MQEQVEIAYNFLRETIHDFRPQIGLVLGSGIGFLADEIANPIKIPYSQIPGFPVSTVAGHAGQLVLGEWQSKRVVAMQGRFHYYEGNTMQSIALPIRVMKLLGIDYLILTNAAGSVNPTFKPGDLMIISDHINFCFNNPLMGINLDKLGPRFPDTQCTYDPGLIALTKKVSHQIKMDLKEGVYMCNTGPSYETPAEIRMARKLGADAVGMSTFPEALAATHCGVKALGISFISNYGAGMSGEKLSHQEVIESIELIKEKFATLMRGIVSAINN